MNTQFDQVLKNLKIEKLNEMQRTSVEVNEKNNNVVLLSSTGSGKTIAFLLPVLQRLNPDNNKTQALVVVPSRELALQIEQVFKTMSTGFKVTSCYGGHKRETEENNLRESPALIIGTPEGWEITCEEETFNRKELKLWC
jgi:superfamily II DNA/RNA helicase